MPKTFAYQVDDETAALIEMDRQRLADELGQPISPSQYHRLVMSMRLQHQQLQGPSANPFQDGYAEGVKAGYSDVNAAIQQAVNALSGARGRGY